MIHGYVFSFRHSVEIEAQTEGEAWERFWSLYPDADPNDVVVDETEDDEVDNTIYKGGAC